MEELPEQAYGHVRDCKDIAKEMENKYNCPILEKDRKYRYYV
jgi:hypothetical protein